MASTIQPIHPSWKGEVPHFDDEYELLVALQYDLREARPHKKRVGPVRVPQRCASCEQTEPVVSFTTAAHLIAASLGNRTYFSTEECDACNLVKGKTDEDELGKMLLPQRTIGRVRSRDGTPKVKAEGGSSIGGGRFDGALVLMLDRDDKTIRFERTGAKTAEVAMPAPSYRPWWAMRSVLRSTLLAMGEEARNRHPWLRTIITGEREPEQPEFFEFVLPGQSDSVLLEVWQRRASSKCETAPLVVRLVFVNVALVWCSPDPRTLKHGPSLIPTIGPAQPPAARHFRLLEAGAKREACEVTFSFSFESIVAGGAEQPAFVPRPSRPHPMISLDFEASDGAVYRITNALLTKSNIDGEHPYFEIRGGSFAGWLALRKGEASSVELRFEYLPHLAGPADARLTLDFLRALDQVGRLSIRSLPTGKPLLHVDKGAAPSTMVMPDIGGFLDDLDAINRVLGLNLHVPEPPATLPVREAAILAAAMARGRIAEKVPAPLKMKVAAASAREMLTSISRGLSFAMDSETPLELLGATIDAGRQRTVVVQPRLVGEAAVLGARIAKMADDEQVDIEIACEMLVHEFERWMPKSTLNETPVPP